jgi:hypothetical protein
MLGLGAGTAGFFRDVTILSKRRDMHNEEDAQDPQDYRTGLGQTAYKRGLAYEHLGICAQDVERVRTA